VNMGDACIYLISVLLFCSMLITPNSFLLFDGFRWMGTRQQIWEWHTEICLGGFLPPFDSPHYNFDGLDPRNVEFWSGGLNLFTARHACNMQRLVSLDPDNFARHLIYHSANNKQRQLSGKKKSFVKINDLYGQLLTVSKDAEDKMKESTKQ
jgi:hypothetical protein